MPIPPSDGEFRHRLSPSRVVSLAFMAPLEPLSGHALPLEMRVAGILMDIALLFSLPEQHDVGLLVDQQ